VHLRGGEARAVVLGHRLQHVVDQVLDLGRADALRRYRLGDPAEHGMPEAGDLEHGHVFLSPRR
jgi:hypothetical protein